MLHPNGKQRLYRVLPQEYEVEWRHPITDNTRSTTVEPDIRWQEDDHEIRYPVIAMEISPEGVSRQSFGDDEGDDVYRRPRPDDDTIAYEEYIGRPVYGELHITVAVNSSHGGIPKRVVADAIAHDVFFAFEFDSEHLNTRGTTADGEPVPYEWPMSVYQYGGSGVTNMNRMVDEQSVQRRSMVFRVDYSLWRHEEVPATDEIEYELAFDHDYDGEIDAEYGPYVVDIYPQDGDDEDDGTQ